MSKLNQVTLPVATNRMSKLDLSCNHSTTMEFMRLQPVYYCHLMKGESINFDCLSIVQPMPMNVPCFGRIRQNLRGFFVPYRLAFPQWHSFYNDVIGSNASNSSLVSSPPLLPSNIIRNVLVANSVGTTTEPAVYDFYWNGTYHTLTDVGRRYYKILYSLGYEVLSQYISDKDEIVEFNALAILAYAKIYIDWYANSQYLNSADVLSIERMLSYNDPTTPLTLTSVQLTSILSIVDTVIYDSNGYFEGAWDNPVSPVNGQFTSFVYKDFTDVNNSDTPFTQIQFNNGTPYMRQVSASESHVGSQYIHDALKKITDYTRRHALSGARSIDRVLAQYGIVTDSLKMNRSIYCGCQSNDVQIGRITATANGVSGSNESSQVGDYAGCGFCQNKKSWDFKSDEEGIFIVMASILPSGGYFQGYDRHNRHIDKHDFFVPELDGLSVQAIEKGEVFVPHVPFTYNGVGLKGVFGFTGRYGEYKRSIDRVSGDIALPSVLAGGNSWHLEREFTPTYFASSTDYITHSLAFTRGADGVQFNRIFQYTENDRDPFICHFNFAVGAYAPCRPLFESYDFEDSGKKVTMETNGSKLN